MDRKILITQTISLFATIFVCDTKVGRAGRQILSECEKRWVNEILFSQRLAAIYLRLSMVDSHFQMNSAGRHK